MCQVSAEKKASPVNSVCGCECCPIMLPIDEEIGRLEEHRKILTVRIEGIDRKIAGLKTVKQP